MKVFRLKFVIYSIMLWIILTLFFVYIYIKQDEINIPNNISFLNTVFVWWTLILALNALYIAYEIFSIQNNIILSEKLILKYKSLISESEKELSIYEIKFNSIDWEDTEWIWNRIDNVKKVINENKENIKEIENKLEKFQWEI